MEEERKEEWLTNMCERRRRHATGSEAKRVTCMCGNGEGRRKSVRGGRPCRGEEEEEGEAGRASSPDFLLCQHGVILPLLYGLTLHTSVPAASMPLICLSCTAFLSLYSLYI